MYFSDHGMGWGLMTVHGIGSILFIVILAMVVVVLVRSLVGPRDGGSTTRHTDSAREILAQRYARGEIDRDEFLRRMKDLS